MEDQGFGASEKTIEEEKKSTLRQHTGGGRSDMASTSRCVATLSKNSSRFLPQLGPSSENPDVFCFDVPLSYHKVTLPGSHQCSFRANAKSVSQPARRKDVARSHHLHRRAAAAVVS